MAENVSDIETFSAMLDDYITLVEHITRQRSEPRFKELSVTAEYRWDVDTSSRYLLDHPLAAFSTGERAEVERFLAAVRVVPLDAPELGAPIWARSQELGLQLLPLLRLHRQRLPDFR